MRVLYVVSEVFPLVKTGGLADVAAALPAALREHNIDIRVVVPGYRQAIERAPKPREVAAFSDVSGCGEARLLATRLPGSAVPVWLVDCPALFDRAGTAYQDQNGCDWPDNAERFGRFNQIAVQLALGELVADWRADLIHANDWHAALVPLLLSRRAGPRPPTVLTIHNLAYQGIFPAGSLARLGLPDGPDVLEFYGQISFLKAGISLADALTTVSRTYAKEIVTPEYGCGLDGVLRQRADRLVGIMNGANYGIWDPGSDSYLPCTYTVRRLAAKRLCKSALQDEMGLEIVPDAPLIAFMSRLAHQKMPDIVLKALPAALSQGAQCALVAEGDADYERRFRELATAYPGRVAVHIGYEEPLAHRLLAGADILLHPSRHEPCGLVPIYAMRYGTLPVVRKCGGTADSVVDALAGAIHCKRASGFSFEGTHADDIITCVGRALECYRQPITWRKLQICAMRQDFSWNRSAQAYADLYRSLLGEEVAAARGQTRDSRLTA